MFKNGIIYEGSFQAVPDDGVGKMRYEDGRIEQVIWENGTMG